MHHAAILLGLCLMATATLSHADESAWRNFMAAATDAAKRGDQSAAAANYENAVKAAAAFAGTDTRLAAALFGLGRAKRAQHDNAAAENSYLRALAILDASPKASDAARAEIYNALGDVSRVQGRYKPAEDYYQRELAQLAKLHGADSAAVATALSNNMASLYRAQGRHDEAEAAYLRALGILEKGVPSGDERLGIALIDLAEWFQGRQQYAKAEPYYRRGIPILQKVFPPAHPRILSLLQEWGQVRQLQGHYTDAEAVYRAMLALIETHRGADHPNAAVALNNLIGLYEAQGRLADADALRQRMLQIANTPYRGQPYVPYQGNPKPPRAAW
jgi:tetratricopeptide (TPR) repeat protein